MPAFRATGQALLHYDEHGDGPPLVALAGGAACHPGYLGDLARLPVRLVAPHLRGVGRSPAQHDTARGSYWRQAADLEALREHLGLRRLTLAGHSAATRMAIATRPSIRSGSSGCCSSARGQTTWWTCHRTSTSASTRVRRSSRSSTGL